MCIIYRCTYNATTYSKYTRAGVRIDDQFESDPMCRSIIIGLLTFNFSAFLVVGSCIGRLLFGEDAKKEEECVSESES